MNGHLHMKVRIEPRSDQILAYDCVDKVKRIYRYSHFKRHWEPAFSMGEAAKLLNRSYYTLVKYVFRDEIISPQIYESPVEGSTFRKRFLNREDILQLHEYMQLQHCGHPRRDGIIVPKEMPTREQLVSRINSDQIYYIMDAASGKMVPVFRPEW